jgi:hypothetical protein
VFEGASVDLKVAREGASLTDRLLLSGRARVPGLVAGVPDFLEGQVDLEIRATKRSFAGDFKVFGAFFALVDAEVGVAGGLPFDPSAAGFDVTAKFRAGFSSAVAAIAEPLVTEIKRVLEIVGPIVDDLTGAGSDPATVLAPLPGRLNQIGVPVPAEVGKISTAVGTFLSAVDAAKAPFRAFNAVAGEFGLPTIPEPSLPLTPGQIVEAALTGYDLGQLTDNPFGFEGFEVPRIPELCNGGLGTFVNGTCYTSPPTDPVYEYACLLWPLDDVCDWVLVWPGSPGVEGIATPSFCPPFSAEAPDGRCYAGVLPVPAPTIPGACATVPGFLPAGAGCSFGSILLTVLDAPLRIALGAVLDIDITDTAT